MRKIILLIFFTFFLRCNSEQNNEMFFYPGQEWCKIKVDKYKGWVKKDSLWGRL